MCYSLLKVHKMNTIKNKTFEKGFLHSKVLVKIFFLFKDAYYCSVYFLQVLEHTIQLHYRVVSFKRCTHCETQHCLITKMGE